MATKTAARRGTKRSRGEANESAHPIDMDFTSKTLKLDKVRTDGGTQMRVARNQEVVDEYAERYRNGKDMPDPDVVYDGDDYWLVDGFQRLEGAAEAELDELRFRVFKGTQRDAVLRAVGANASHGLRRADADKRRAVMTLLNDKEWCQSDRWIADRCKVSHGLVGKVRAIVEEQARMARYPKDEPAGFPGDIPADFRPNPQHSPPAGTETVGENNADEGDQFDAPEPFQLDSSPVETTLNPNVEPDYEPQLYDPEPDGESESSAWQTGANDQPADEPEYREGLDGRRRRVKRKPAPAEPPDVNPFGADDDSPAAEQGFTAIGEPVTELTAESFDAVPQVAAWGREVDRLLREATRLADYCTFADRTFIETSLRNAKKHLLENKPYAHCHECQGEGCRTCRSGGTITKAQHERLLKEKSALDEEAA